MELRSQAVTLSVALVAFALIAPDARAAWPTDSRVNLPVCRAVGAQYNPVLALDGAGGVYIAWRDERATDSKVYAMHVLPSGVVDPAWPVDGLRVCEATGDQLSPSMIASGDGVLLAWLDRREGGFDVYVQRVQWDGTLDPAFPKMGLLVAHASTVFGVPERLPLASDGAGGAILAWTDLIGADYNARAQHVVSSGMLDPAWPAASVLLCGLAEDQLPTSIVSDGAGGAIVVWDDYRGGSAFDVYAHRVLSTGVVDPAWPIDGRVICAVAGTQAGGTIVPDGAGGGVVAWNDQRGANFDITAHHLFPGGALDAAWPPNGRALVVATGDQNYSVAVADGAGGAIVAWMDGRSGEWDIYAQHVLAGGAVDPAWPVNGFGIATIGHQMWYPAIVSDGARGAIVSWLDQRFVGGAEFMHHLRANGTVDPVWPGDGCRFSWTTGTRHGAALIGDGHGGAIAAWMDDRSPTTVYDIYAQRVLADGTLGGNVTDVGPPSRAGLGLRVLGVHPLRGGALRLELQLPGEAVTSLELIDVSGRRLARRDLGALGTGGHEVTLAETDRLPPGLYFARLWYEGHALTTRVVRLD